YCPAKALVRTDSPAAERANVQVPVESAQVSDFRSVRKDNPHGSKNGNLSYSHAHLHARTDRMPESGARNGSTSTETPSGDPGDIPECLRRHLCDHCGGAVGGMRNYEWPGRPDGIWLHAQCEALWFDLEGRP